MSTFFECDTTDSKDVINKVKANHCLKTSVETEDINRDRNVCFSNKKG